MNPNQHVEAPNPVVPAFETVATEPVKIETPSPTTETSSGVPNNHVVQPEVAVSAPVVAATPSEVNQAPIPLTDDQKLKKVDELMTQDVTAANASDLADRVAEIEI